MFEPKGRWLIFFDLDDTVMCGYDDVRPRVLRAFKTLKGKGHRLVVSTGRPRIGIPAPYYELADAAITLTGAGCSIGGRQIVEKYLRTQDILAFTAECARLQVGVFLENDERSGTFGAPEWFAGTEAAFHAQTELHILTQRQLKEALSGGLRFSHICLSAENYGRLRAAQAPLPEDLFVFPAGKSADVVMKGVSKGSAARLVLDHFKWPLHRTLCFGDSENDLDIFRECFVRVSIGAGSERLAAESSFSAPAADRDGVVEALIALGFLTE